MASSHLKQGNLKDELTCSVCCEMFANTESNTPIMLLCCQNVFCQRCIDNVNNCPQCRKAITQASQRPCRVLLKILECLCYRCHRREREQNCLHCNIGLCHACVPEHVKTHDEDISLKEAELKEVLQQARDFIDNIQSGLDDLKAKLHDREISLTEESTEDSLKLTIPASSDNPNDDSLSEAKLAENIEKVYSDKLIHHRQVRDHLAEHILPLLVNIAKEIKIPVPTTLTNFNRKQLFQSINSVSNFDISLPGDAVVFVGVMAVDKILSQIRGQPCVDRRHLINSSTPQFHLMPEECATCNLTYNNCIIIGTDSARVVVCRDQCLESVLPAVTFGNHRPICGLAVTTAVDGTEMVLAVDMSDKVHRHALRFCEGPWDIFYVGDGDIEFNDICVRDDVIYLASDERILLISRVAEQEMKSVVLFGPEQNPLQMAIISDDLVLLRVEDERKIYLKSLTEPTQARSFDFSFTIHDMAFDDERRLLSLIGHYDALDNYALHTYLV